jgi:hypothetical protein
MMVSVALVGFRANQTPVPSLPWIRHAALHTLLFSQTRSSVGSASWEVEDAAGACVLAASWS